MKSPLLRGALGSASVTFFVAATAAALVAQPLYAATSTRDDSAATQERGTMQDSSRDSTQDTRGNTSSDTMITTKVKAAFVKDETVHALKIKVVTNNGIVQLSGFASSAEEAERATEVARQVPGVKDVKSTIQLRQGKDRDKDQMRDKDQTKEQGKGY